MRCLRVPALRRIFISPPVNALFRRLSQVIQRSGCHIQEIELWHGTSRVPAQIPVIGDYTALPSLFSSLTHLQRLTVNNADLTLVGEILEESSKCKRRCSRLAWLTVDSKDQGCRPALGSCMSHAIVTSFSRVYGPSLRRYRPLVQIRQMSLWGIDLVRFGRGLHHRLRDMPYEDITHFTVHLGRVAKMTMEVVLEGKPIGDTAIQTIQQVTRKEDPEVQRLMSYLR